MNYIAQLRQDKRFLELNIKYAHAALDELTAYLLSPKFHQDPTVQVADVLRRLDPLKEALLMNEQDHLRLAEYERQLESGETY